MPVPQYHELFNPTLVALHRLGGSGSIREIAEAVLEETSLPDEVVRQIHGKGPQSELEYRLAWARTYLKNYGLLESSQRGIWALTLRGRTEKTVDAGDVVRHTRELLRNREGDKASPNLTTETLDEDSSEDVNSDAWRVQVLELLQDMAPDAFERLCQRLLRESGFIEVEVTGRTGDGGIDGHGIIRLAGLVSFPVLFQCKRYVGSVTPSQVRDFRGALAGRADKGLVITTGTFTRDASREATREGAPPIDLINGELLIDKLKELGLGIETRQIEEVKVNANFFKDI